MSVPPSNQPLSPSLSQASGNVAGLCNWASAMCTYHSVAKEVEPKIVALWDAEARLTAAEADQTAAEGALAGVQAGLARAQADFEAAVANKARLEEDAAATAARADAAESLLAALAGEEARWTAQAADFGARKRCLAGECLAAAAFTSYAGLFGRDARARLGTAVSGALADEAIPCSDGMTSTAFLVDDAEAAGWATEVSGFGGGEGEGERGGTQHTHSPPLLPQGLPTDELSVQNGALVTQASLVPLLVDPQGQGAAWLATRAARAGAPLRTLRADDPRFRAALEAAASDGATLLVDWRGGELDSVLEPLLDLGRSTSGRAASVTVTLGDRDVDVAPSFRLFLATPDASPPLSPELCARVAVVDFTVTQAGLEDQLLARLVARERADLQARRAVLTRDAADARARIVALEADLLTRLSSAQGNLLDDGDLVAVLTTTKQEAGAAADRLARAAATDAALAAAANEFRPAAARGALLYFLVLDFVAVNPLYATGLAQFCRLYDGAVHATAPSPFAATRTAAIVSTLTAAVTAFVGRGLYEAHKLVFVVALALRVAAAEGRVTPADIDDLVRETDAPAHRKKPKDWLPDAAWRSACAAAASGGVLRDLPDSLARADAGWRAWCEAPAPERLSLPDLEAKGAVPPFARAAAVAALRRDRALPALAAFVAAELGPSFAEAVPSSVEGALGDASPERPVLCLLSRGEKREGGREERRERGTRACVLFRLIFLFPSSSGSDPTSQITDLARRHKVRVHGVSMGQGQEAAARRALAAAAEAGAWALLQNAHLGLGVLADVEALLASPDKLHPDFRLFITTAPCDGFPAGIVEVREEGAGVEKSRRSILLFIAHIPHPLTPNRPPSKSSTNPPPVCAPPCAPPTPPCPRTPWTPAARAPSGAPCCLCPPSCTPSSWSAAATGRLGTMCPTTLGGTTWLRCRPTCAATWRAWKRGVRVMAEAPPPLSTGRRCATWWPASSMGGASRMMMTR